MPRRRSRFSDLERLYRESGGVAAAGSKLAGYIEFKQGRSHIKVEQKLTAEQRKRVGYAILPFSLSVPATPNADDRYAAPITNYSNTGRRSLNLSDRDCGYENIVAATTQADNFYPALIRCFVASSTTAATPISAVTKHEYNRIPGRSYSIPFGRTMSSVTDAKTGAAESTLDDVDQEDVRGSLTLQAKAGGAKSVSFEPEVFKTGKADLASPASTNP